MGPRWYPEALSSLPGPGLERPWVDDCKETACSVHLYLLHPTVWLGGSPKWEEQEAHLR